MACRSAFLHLSPWRTFRAHQAPALPSKPSFFQRPETSIHISFARPASQLRPRKPPPRYSRFGRAQQVYGLWQTSPGFRYGVGAVGLGGGIFYWHNLERVPISGRLRFNCVSANLEKQISAGGYQQILQQYGRDILPENHSYSRMVTRVMERLIPQSGLVGEDWEVRVIDDKNEKNAFVMPG